MNQGEKLLLTAGRLADLFTREDLAIAAWQEWPDDFAMKYHDHPDTQKVYAWLSHRKGPVKLGCMGITPKLHLTDKGIRVAAELREKLPRRARGRPVAIDLWEQGAASRRLRLEHALEFFGVELGQVRSGKSAEIITSRLADLRQIDTPDGRSLYNLADFLVWKFGRILAPGKALN